MEDQSKSEADQYRDERDRCKAELNKYKTWVPPGHPLSPIPCWEEVERKFEDIFYLPQHAHIDDLSLYLPKEIPGVDLNPTGQLELFSKLKRYHDEQPFTAQRSAQRRFHFENPAYSYLDALVLYAMIRHLRPKRIIEAGGGYSSGVILDTSELFFENSIECTFIEPHPELLKSLMKDGDLQRAELIEARLQDVPLEKFQHPEAGDILFVDSSHVSKVDSDVNYCLFKLLPQLKSGVYVHFHDVFYPFEYPAEWIQEGRSWNEAYLLRAFLQYNQAFEIQLFTTYLVHFYRSIIAEGMPLGMKNTGGCIWIRKK